MARLVVPGNLNSGIRGQDRVAGWTRVGGRDPFLLACRRAGPRGNSYGSRPPEEGSRRD